MNDKLKPCPFCGGKAKKVNEEKDKLQKEIQDLKNSIEARDHTIKALLEIANKAEHDRDRYKRRIDVLQKNQPRYIITPKMPTNITLDDLLKNTYIVENWDSSVDIIPTRAEIEKETAEKILERGKYNMPEHLKDWIVEQFGVEVEDEV